MKNLTEDEFDARFTVIPDTRGDTVRPRADGIDVDSKQLWTIVEAEGSLYAISGWHFVNRIGYILTEEAWDQETDFAVEDTDDEEAAASPWPDTNPRLALNVELGNAWTVEPGPAGAIGTTPESTIVGPAGVSTAGCSPHTTCLTSTTKNLSTPKQPVITRSIKSQLHLNTPPKPCRSM